MGSNRGRVIEAADEARAKRLIAEGKPYREIARITGMHRKTVARVAAGKPKK